jgi:hypothetical protein
MASRLLVERLALLLALLQPFGPLGCARMSEATPKLSAELGSRIAEMQGLHELTLTRFFDAERKRIQDFLDREWTPLFLQNFLGMSGLLQAISESGYVSGQDSTEIQAAVALYLDDPEAEAAKMTGKIVAAVRGARTGEEKLVRPIVADFVEGPRADTAVTHIVSLLKSEDPGTLILEWAGDAQEQINAQRTSMMAPIDEAERLARSELAEAYGEMAQANGAITGRLEAAARASAQQTALLSAFGVDSTVSKRLQQRLGGVSAAVGDALTTAEESLDKSKDPSDLGNALLRALREKLGAANR